MARAVAASVCLGALGFMAGVFVAALIIVRNGVQMPNEGASVFGFIMAIGGAAAGVWLATYIPRSRS